ncbi:MAG: hypothetical protein LBK67_11155 [Coriobacteriales bacterium]|jgi:hypothetical protein|nr:hypothetical protein [Coriobacteriales bacterium]
MEKAPSTTNLYGKLLERHEDGESSGSPKPVEQELLGKLSESHEPTKQELQGKLLEDDKSGCDAIIDTADIQNLK